MKRKILLVTLMILAGLTSTLQAQETADTLPAKQLSEEDSIIAVYNAKKTDPATMDFHFVYIDHEPQPATPATKLCTRIKKLRENAAETGNALVIYLANEDKPFLSFTNLPDPEGLHRDHADAFYDIVDEIQNYTSHEVDAEVDMENFKKLIGGNGTYPLFDEVTGVDTMRYRSVTVDFYIGPRFWNLNHNDNVIAQCYMILRLAKYMKMYPRRRLAFDVFKAKGQELIYQEGKPFGLLNKDGINDNPKVNTIKEY